MTASVAAMAAAEEARSAKAKAEVTARVKKVRAKADTRIATCRVHCLTWKYKFALTFV